MNRADEAVCVILTSPVVLLARSVRLMKIGW
jgi:hypothetical protein